MARRTTVNIPLTPELDAFNRLKAKLERGASQAERGELLDGDEVFDELRQLIEERRRAKRKALKR